MYNCNVRLSRSQEREEEEKIKQIERQYLDHIKKYYNLPPLYGTKKQMQWAEEIRRKAWNRNSNNPEFLKNAYAGWFIENRHKL